MADNINNDHLNRDPITGEPGSHPIGTAVGGLGGAAAGAAIGAIGGPLGMLIGGAIGAIAGGSAGHAAGEAIDPTVEDTYWNDTYRNTTYYKEGYDYSTDYQPAYAVGYANRARYPVGTSFESVESDLERSWNEVKGNSRLAWAEAREAIRDGWDKTEARIAGHDYAPRLRSVDGYAAGEEKGHPVATGTGALGGSGRLGCRSCGHTSWRCHWCRSRQRCRSRSG